MYSKATVIEYSISSGIRSPKTYLHQGQTTIRSASGTSKLKKALCSKDTLTLSEDSCGTTRFPGFWRQARGTLKSESGTPESEPASPFSTTTTPTSTDSMHTQSGRSCTRLVPETTRFGFGTRRDSSPTSRSRAS